MQEHNKVSEKIKQLKDSSRKEPADVQKLIDLSKNSLVEKIKETIGTF